MAGICWKWLKKDKNGWKRLTAFWMAQDTVPAASRRIRISNFKPQINLFFHNIKGKDIKDVRKKRSRVELLANRTQI